MLEPKRIGLRREDAVLLQAGDTVAVPAVTERVPVWDVAVRLFHWALVVSVATAWFTGGTGSRVHEISGFIAGGLLLFRLVWGFAGTRYARFSEFVRSPRAMFGYLKDILRNRAERHIGHNPAGGYMILVMLLCLAVIVGTGVMQLTNQFFGVVWVETVHHYAANAFLALIPLHLLGVLMSSWMHQENLVGAMFSGNKVLDADEAARTSVPTLQEQILTRLHANQGFTALLFLAALGGFAGWTMTERNVSNAVVEATPTPAVTAVTQAIQDSAATQSKERQDYVIGGPESASQTWLISSGGRLYDNWAASLGVKAPAKRHPAWPTANTSISNEDTWRCKNCHGWDYMGRDGQYRSGANATGIAGVQKARGRDPAVIMSILGNAAHGYTDEILPQHAKYRLALFVSRGQHNAAQFVLANDKIKGDAEQGRPIFQNVCASCHGFDGRARKLGGSPGRPGSNPNNAIQYVGTKAQNGPIEVLHKICNGHPGAIMVSMRGFPIEVAANLLAYAQTLPKE